MQMGELVKIHGNKWIKIAAEMGPEFSANSCRAMYVNLMRQYPGKYHLPRVQRIGGRRASLGRPVYATESSSPESPSSAPETGDGGAAWPPVAVVTNMTVTQMLYNTRVLNSYKLMSSSSQAYNVSEILSKLPISEAMAAGAPRQRRVPAPVAPETMLLASPLITEPFTPGPGDSTRWTYHEDDLLYTLTSLYGEQWPLIAEIMHRSPEDVMLRHDFKVARSKLRIGFSKDEDAKILAHVQQYGSERWDLISTELDRPPTEIIRRFQNTLDPRLKWRPWSPAEDERLKELREGSGYTWAMISAVIDRAEPSCRYRYNKIFKKAMADEAASMKTKELELSG